MQERKTNCGLLHDSGVHTVSILITMETLNIDQTEIILSDSAILERREARGIRPKTKKVS